MICVSILERTVEGLLAALDGVPFAEVRLDPLRPSSAEMKRIFSREARLVATMRPGSLGEDERVSFLVEAITCGADLVDVELEMSRELRTGVIEKANAADCRVIVSFHDFDRTPTKETLETIVNRCFDAGAHIAKIACAVSRPEEGARLLGLLDDLRPVIPVGMGEAGRITRVVAPLLGSPFTFAARDNGETTAPGQMTTAQLTRAWKALGHG